ncbi:MAG: HAMP domain-containing histidine kinase, partial [Planctomycetales bacterium]|nr:HAMP domain-containing histidine kinase [Planctomycetales bacterium]
MRSLYSTGGGRDFGSWPLLLLLLAVIVPSGGVIWMMRQAMESEQLAVRQRMADVYQAQLESARQRVDVHWQQWLAEMEKVSAVEPASACFAQFVAEGVADSLVVCSAEGEVRYPNQATESEPLEDPTAWTAASRLETTQGDLARAAAAYGEIAAQQPESHLTAQALQAQARCLLRLDVRPAAIAVLRKLSTIDELAQAGERHLTANAGLQLLELLEHDSPEWNDEASRLRARLKDYGSGGMPGSQRRFLMRELVERWPQEFEFATLEAEMLAADYLATLPEPANGETFDGIALEQTQIAGVWRVRQQAHGATALLRAATLQRLVSDSLRDQQLPAGVVLQPLQPGEMVDSARSAPTVALAPTLPGWQLALVADDHELGDGGERVALFAWIALVVIGATLLLTWLVVQAWWRQQRVARLKNDLVATISHELRTPLSSIRLLVDTLLDESHQVSADQAREYLGLIARENSRLTRLIDNFLTFSRMERGKRQVELQPIDAREVIAQSADAVQERFAASGNALIVEAEEPAPVRGDLELLVTSVVNLLDNAWKYTGDSKRVRLSCQRQGDRVVIAVEDNGIGLPRQAREKVFERFYQVDRRVARSAAGCGLGLSIVKYLVEAHGGEVRVESEPGVGSTFSISLPA